MKNKSTEMIKLLLKYIIEKYKKENEFIKVLQDNNCLYDIYITPKMDFPLYEFAEILGIEDENESEKIFELIIESNNIEDTINMLIDKYNI